MSVTVTKSTFERTLPYFLVKVLRNELSDTHSPERSGSEWILKSQPSDGVNVDDLPRIILDASPTDHAVWNLTGTKYDTTTTVECFIMCGGSNTNNGSMADRDDYSDKIREIFTDPTSAESDGTSLQNNSIKLNRFSSRVEDFISAGNVPKVIRTRVLSMDFVYYGG